MRRVLFCSLAGLQFACCFQRRCLPPVILPIIRCGFTSFSTVRIRCTRTRNLDGVDGEGRRISMRMASRGLRLQILLRNRLMNSMGYETYPARWKKPGKDLQYCCRRMAAPATSRLR